MGKQAQSKPVDAVELLKGEHVKVKQAFKKYEELGDRAFVAKKKLADEICADLTLHTKIEEEIFYPAFRDSVKDSKSTADEALVEHQSAKTLIREISAMGSEDDLFDAKVKVLSEQIDHHVKEEEEEMFPAMRKTDVDLKALGERMATRKQELG